MVTVDELMNELHIDDTPEERSNMQSILNDATALIDADCSSANNLDALHQDPIYTYCIKVQFYRLYTDRNDSFPGSDRLLMWKKKLQLKYGDDNNSDEK